jgi:hypothetical protein
MTSALRQLRHDLRGNANCLMLCTAALMHSEKDEAMEFIDEIISSTDKIIASLDSLEAMPEHFVETPPV